MKQCAECPAKTGTPFPDTLFVREVCLECGHYQPVSWTKKDMLMEIAYVCIGIVLFIPVVLALIAFVIWRKAHGKNFRVGLG